MCQIIVVKIKTYENVKIFSLEENQNSESNYFIFLILITEADVNTQTEMENLGMNQWTNGVIDRQTEY